MRQINCPVCGADARSVLMRGGDLYHHLPGEFSLVRCGCGLVFINPQPDNAELATFYPDDYLAHQARARPPRLGRHRAFKTFILRWYYGCPMQGAPPPRWARVLMRPLLFWFSLGTMKSMLPYHGGGAILDVGCGNAGWLSALKEYGWRVQGVELDEPAARAAADAGVPVACGTLLDAQFSAASFDVVRLHYVLEHLVNPAETLDEIRRILKPDGLCYIRIPNIASLTYRLFGRYWFPLDIPRHVFHYTPATFTRLARQHGFAVRHIEFRSPPSGFFTSLEFMRQAGVLPRILGPLREQSSLWRNLWRPVGWCVDWLRMGDIVQYTLSPERRA